MPQLAALEIVLILTLVISFVGAEENLTEECDNLFKRHNPMDCCPSLPAPHLNTTEYRNCQAKCKENQGECCLSDCAFEAAGIYVDGKYNVERLQEGFELFFNDSMSDAREKFAPIIKLSLEKCGNLIELAPSNKCKVPEGLHKIVQCADHFNFVNCPTSLYNSSDECKLTKEFVESQDTCGFKAGEVFIIDHRFFDEDEDAGNETEVTSTTVVE